MSVSMVRNEKNSLLPRKCSTNWLPVLTAQFKNIRHSSHTVCVGVESKFFWSINLLIWDTHRLHSFQFSKWTNLLIRKIVYHTRSLLKCCNWHVTRMTVFFLIKQSTQTFHWNLHSKDWLIWLFFWIHRIGKLELKMASLECDSNSKRRRKKFCNFLSQSTTSFQLFILLVLNAEHFRRAACEPFLVDRANGKLMTVIYESRDLKFLAKRNEN